MSGALLTTLALLLFLGAAHGEEGTGAGVWLRVPVGDVYYSPPITLVEQADGWHEARVRNWAEVRLPEGYVRGPWVPPAPAGFSGVDDDRDGFGRILLKSLGAGAVDVGGTLLARELLNDDFVERNEFMRDGFIWKKGVGTVLVSGVAWIVERENPGAARWIRRGYVSFNVGLGVYAVALTW